MNEKCGSCNYSAKRHFSSLALRDSVGCSNILFIAGIDCVSESQLMLEALDGFLILISDEGTVYYVSEQVYNYIGVCQVCLKLYQYSLVLVNTIIHAWCHSC